MTNFKRHADERPPTEPDKMKTPKLTFSSAINWEWVHSHHPIDAGRVTAESDWLQTIIRHARRNGFTGSISNRGAARVVNQNLY